MYDNVIIVHGDPTIENNLRIENKTSPVVDLKSPQTHHYTISTFPPARNTSWMLILKISNVELKDDPAYHPRHHGMNVVAVSITDNSGAQLIKTDRLL